jgi:hypothetical protein
LETRQCYDKAILEFCNDNPLLQIYQVGEITHPGISDLDFIVLDGKPKVSKNVRHFLQGGNVIIMPSKTFQKINYIEKFNLKLVQGAELPVEQVSSKYFDLIEILEWLPERILLIESLLKKWEEGDRRVLLYLKSLDRSIKKVENMTLSHFSRPSILEIRANYKNHNLKKICYEYHSAAENAWYTFSSSIKEIDGMATGAVNISNHYSFKNRFHKLMIYFSMLLEANLEISKPLNSCVKIENSDCCIGDDFKIFALNRWNILNDTFCWFKKNNIDSGMIKYGWFLKK